MVERSALVGEVVAVDGLVSTLRRVRVPAQERVVDVDLHPHPAWEEVICVEAVEDLVVDEIAAPRRRRPCRPLLAVRPPPEWGDEFGRALLSAGEWIEVIDVEVVRRDDLASPLLRPLAVEAPDDDVYLPCLWVAPPPLDFRAGVVAERGEAGFLLGQVLHLHAAVRLDVPPREEDEAVHEVVLQSGAHNPERARVEVCIGDVRAQPGGGRRAAPPASRTRGVAHARRAQGHGGAPACPGARASVPRARGASRGRRSMSRTDGSGPRWETGLNPEVHKQIEACEDHRPALDEGGRPTG